MPRVRPQRFFAEQSALSRVKANIVFKFVVAWMGVFLGGEQNRLTDEVAYVDLFSGPGTYEDNSRSTPLLIVEAAIRKPKFADGIRFYFNDKEKALIQSLEQEIRALPGMGNLKSGPVYKQEPASISLINSFGVRNDIPQFFFLDQFGWADVMPPMIAHIFKARRCDAVFFIRTNRTIAAVTNKRAEEAMIRLIGKDRLEGLRREFRKPYAQKEKLLLDALKQVCSECGAPYFQAFPFRIFHRDGSKHHLIYLGKHEKGLSIMKEIMGSSSSMEQSGVPVMGYAEVAITPSLFEPDPHAELEQELLRVFAGNRLTVASIYSQHHPTSERFFLRHYQEALRRLEARHAVSTHPVAAERPDRNGVVTMGENVEIDFPVIERKV